MEHSWDSSTNSRPAPVTELPKSRSRALMHELALPDQKRWPAEPAWVRGRQKSMCPAGCHWVFWLSHGITVSRTYGYPISSPSFVACLQVSSHESPILEEAEDVEKQWYWIGKRRIRTGPHPICVIRDYLLHLPGPPFLSSSVWRMCVKHCVWGNVCALRSRLPKELPPKCSVALCSKGPVLPSQPFHLCSHKLIWQSKASNR